MPFEYRSKRSEMRAFILAGNSLYMKAYGTVCAVVSQKCAWYFYICQKHFFIDQKPILQLVDNCTYGNKAFLCIKSSLILDFVHAKWPVQLNVGDVNFSEENFPDSIHSRTRTRCTATTCQSFLQKDGTLKNRQVFYCFSKTKHSSATYFEQFGSRMNQYCFGYY